MPLYGETSGHADYPHFPGTLYDCPECESECYCIPGETQCVHCAIKAEQKLNARAIRYLNRFSY